jgi:hypothetical protein
MKSKSYKIVIGIIGFLGVYILFAGYLSLDKSNPPEEDFSFIQHEIKNENQIAYVVLNAAGTSYLSEIKVGDTVFDVMKKIQNDPENNFSFKYKEYPGMGVFVEEINGIKGEPGKYWIYYINYEKANVGISSNVLKDRDIINWRQE